MRLGQGGSSWTIRLGADAIGFRLIYSVTIYRLARGGIARVSSLFHKDRSRMPWSKQDICRSAFAMMVVTARVGDSGVRAIKCS